MRNLLTADDLRNYHRFCLDHIECLRDGAPGRWEVIWFEVLYDQYEREHIIFYQSLN